MGKSSFQFKQFKIHQDRCAMKVGTDGVLIGAWADISTSRRILDIGTGTGLIALMCAQRNPSASITAIEIDKNSADQARENIQESKFKGRIEVHQVSLQEFESAELFDTIVCNPPFFSSGTLSPNEKRNLARQSDSLELEELIDNALRLLSEDGTLNLIIPLDREAEFDPICTKYKLCTTRRCTVIPNPSKKSKRVMLQCSKVCSDRVDETLMIEKGERFDYTDEFVNLTRDFYPKLK